MQFFRDAFDVFSYLFRLFENSFSKSSKILMLSSAKCFILLTIENTYLCLYFVWSLNTLSQRGVLFLYHFKFSD